MGRGQYIRTKEIREKNRIASLGRIASEESKVKTSNTMKSLGIHPPIGKGNNNSNWKGGMPNCLDCGKKLTQRIYRRCKSCSRKGKLNPNYKLASDKCSRWNGGISSLYSSIRNLFEYRQWRSDVFYRDNFTCQNCGANDKYLNAHHKYSYKSIINDYAIKNIEDSIKCSKLWDINNGITLCIDCHKDIHRKEKIL